MKLSILAPAKHLTRNKQRVTEQIADKLGMHLLPAGELKQVAGTRSCCPQEGQRSLRCGQTKSLLRGNRSSLAHSYSVHVCTNDFFQFSMHSTRKPSISEGKNDAEKNVAASGTVRTGLFPLWNTG